MAENIPQLPFANERQPTPQPNQKFTAEDIRSRMNAINGYLNTNRPAVLTGIAQGHADQAELISKYKTYMNPGTSDVPKVQNLISGDGMTGPNPGLKALDLPTMDYVNALMAKSKLDVATKADPYFFARPTSFNASKYGLNYDRFYSHPKFKELGFSIYRDNEALYNAKSTWSDDFRRMGSKWLGLAWQGGSGMFKNWGQFGAFGEAQDAAQMEHDLSVAMSSKGGAGAWTTNFLANSAYTVGIIGEIAAEEAVLWGSAALTGGATSPLAALRTGQNMARLGKSMKVMAETLGKADKARSFWTAAKGAGTSAANFILPGETLNIGRQALDVNSAYNRLGGMAKATKTFGAFYRDMREINAVTAESRLEGGFVQNKVANDALAAFIKENNRMPNTDEARVISDKAFAAGKATMMLNAPAIYLSNKLVLGTALKGFAPIRRMMNKEALSSNIFKTVSNHGWKAAGKKPMEVVQKGLFSSAKRTFSKDYLKAIPSRLKGTFSAKGARTALGSGMRYFSANLAEGLQESYQEAIQSGMTDYYLTDYFADLYKDPYLAAKNSMGASIMKGLGEQFSMQGLDVFAQGFLMGGVIGGAQNVIMPGAQRGIMKIEDFAKGTNKYEKYVEEEKKRLQAYADAVNSYTENPALYAHWLDENVAIQRDLSERYQLAEETGDRQEAENTKDDSLFNHVHTLLQTGKFDGFVGQLEDLRDLSDTELEEAFGKYDTKSEQNKKSPRQKLETAIKKAKDVQERFDNINEKFKNPYNPDFFDKERDKEAYNAEHLGYTAFEIAKKSIAFNEYTFDRTLSRLNSLVNNAASNGPLGNVAAAEFSALYTSDIAFSRHVEMMNSEIEALSMGSAQDKTLAKKKSTQLKNLQALRDIQKEFKTALLLIEKAKLTGTDAQAEVQKLVKDMARSFAKEMNIVRTSDNVDPLTGQLIIDFDGDYEGEGIADDVIINEFYKEKLYDEYAKYAKNIAELNNVFPILNGIENSFGDLIDYVKLDAQAKHMSEYANIIADPMSIFNMSVRIKNALETVNTRRKELHLEALTDYKENIQDVNDLLEKLFGIGVYFDPDSIKAFRKDGKLPDIFLSATDGSVIDKTNPKYQEIIDLIAAEETLRGKTFSNKPVGPPTPPAPAAPTGPATSTQPPPPAEEPEEFTETTYDVTTPISELPADMQTKLRAAHAEAILSGATSDIQEWMKESPEAAAIVSGVEPVKKGETKKPTPTSTPTGTLISAENPKSIAGPTPDLQPIYDILARAGWKLSEDQTKYVSKDGQEAFRVSDLKEGKPEFTEAMKAAAGRGNIVDEVLRDFATPFTKDKLSLKDIIVNNYIQGKNAVESKQQIAVMVNNTLTIGKVAEKNGYTIDEGFIKDMSNVLYDLALRFQDYTWHTSLPTMVGNLVGKMYGGTIDLLLEKDGKYFIIDLKTSVKSRRLNEKLYDKNDQIQQNAYAELFEQLTGKPISGIYILNLITKTTADRALQAVQLDMHKNEKGQDTVLNPLPRTSVADLKEYKPEAPEETPPTPPPAAPATDAIVDIEKRRQEELKENQRKYDVSKRVNLQGIETFKQKLIDNPNGLEALDGTYQFNIDDRQKTLDKLEKELPINVNKINAEYDAELVAEYRKQEQAELAKAIPNMAEYPDTYGEKQGNMPDALYAIYKPIYDKYDELITPLLPAAPATDTKARIKSKAITKLDQSEKELVKAKKELEEINSNPRAGKTDVPRLEYYIKSLEDIIINARLISQTVDFYIGRWETPNSNGEGVVIDGKTISIPEFTSLYNVASKNLLENYNAELAASGKPTTPEVDWNAVIDRAASAQEVDKIMDQIYAANASSPELIDRALVKKQSFKPAKTKVPSRFAGKVIWAQPGTVNPEIFEKFDVVNSDDIVEEIAARRGITAEEGKTIHQTIQNQPSAVRADIQNEVKAEIERLKGQGKTIITSNWYMQGSSLVDITSSPAEKEAVFMGKNMSPEESIKAFNEWLSDNRMRKDDYLATQEADWVSQQMSGKTLIERNTQATVQQLFEREQVRSTPLRSITNAGNSQYLIDSITAYMYNPEIRGAYTIKDANGVERVLTPEEVAELAKNRAKRLMSKEEFNNFSQEIDKMMAQQVTPTQTTVSQEDKSSAQDAINSASEMPTAKTNEIVNNAENKSQKNVDDDFDNNLNCE
jgi:hypothetical protein